MIETALIIIAISAGFLSFLSPCGVVILPAFISYYIGRKDKGEEEPAYKRGFMGAKLGLYAALGIISIFSLVGILILVLGNFIKTLIPWFTIIVGVVLLIVGFLMLFDKSFHFSLPSKVERLADRLKSSAYKKDNVHDFTKFYLFGIGYGLAVMSCTLPVFLLVIFEALNAGGIFQGAIIFLLYSGAAGIGVITLTTTTALSKDFMQKNFSKIFPYVQKVTAIVIILAAIYLIYYQININNAFAVFGFS